MSNTEKELTVEEMKALLDGIEVKYRSNATKSTLKHLISKHKAKVESVVKTSQESIESDLDVLGQNVILPEGSDNPDINVESDTSELGLDETTGVSDGDKVYEKSVSDDNILSENTTPVSDEVVAEKELPERLVIKRNVLKTFIEDLFVAGRNGYTLSNERYSVSIMDMPWRTVLVKSDTGDVQPLVQPAIKIKVKTYKSKDFINELLHFARYGARVGAIKNITIDSGHYVFEVLVDKEYVLRKNKDYYSGRV